MVPKRSGGARLLGLAGVALMLTGCTAGQWYEGVKQGAENACNRQPAGAREDCLSRLNKKNYDDYEKERANRAP